MKISQREARRLKKRVEELERMERDRLSCYASEYPGVHLGTESLCVPLAASVQTARKLGYSVCVQMENEKAKFYAARVKLASSSGRASAARSWTGSVLRTPSCNRGACTGPPMRPCPRISRSGPQAGRVVRSSRYAAAVPAGGADGASRARRISAASGAARIVVDTRGGQRHE